MASVVVISRRQGDVELRTEGTKLAHRLIALQSRVLYDLFITLL